MLSGQLTLLTLPAADDDPDNDPDSDVDAEQHDVEQFNWHGSARNWVRQTFPDRRSLPGPPRRGHHYPTHCHRSSTSRWLSVVTSAGAVVFDRLP